MIGRSLGVAFLFLVASVARADGTRDNRPENVRPIPPKGITIPSDRWHTLKTGVEELETRISRLRDTLRDRPELTRYLPDVEIYHKAVRNALLYGEFYKRDEVYAARSLIRHGIERADQLSGGLAPWEGSTGLVVRGYVSKIDGSTQPYGLIVPKSYHPDSPHRFRLDVWCHGRGETLSELSFLHQRENHPGEFTPPDTFVLHPYGRYCNANKFAGEIDLFEAIEDIKGHYPIDEDRIVMRGFSMGGAACWQFAVHYPSLWAAAAPGAGFSETADFLKVFQHERLKPTWYEQKLWHLYDCTDYAINLFNCPTVAYSGEKDSQKQAADMMEKALKDEGIILAHVIGKNAKHHYTPEAKAEINRRIDSIVKLGRNPMPQEVQFTTWTLRYNRSFWVQVDGMEQHWERARVEADILGDTKGPVVHTQNVSALTLDFPAGHFSPEFFETDIQVTIDGQAVPAPPPLSDRSWTAHFRKVDGNWKAVPTDHDGTLRKRHGLQGPIDDAFMDSFLMVRPSAAPLNEKVSEWTETEMKHAIEHWRRQFRGEARVKTDIDVNDEDIARHNLVLWGDPTSNKVMAKIIAKLPIGWDHDNVHLGEKTFAAGHHIPVLVYPNPLNPKRYVVLNSGFTFREYDYLNNARQVPKLPDYAVIDIDQPVTSRAPGKIVAAGFFDETWRLTDE